MSLVIVVVLAGLYVTGWSRLARRARRPLATPRLAAAMAALAAVAVALVSPLDGLAHESFSAHMVQHLLLMTVAAPLALAADPFPILLWALPGRARRAVGARFADGGALRAPLRALTWMPLAWLVGAVALWLWHVPALYDRALDHGAV
ncbi:MAG TPA: cytochrome c oxidase assembly protein, partial [Solirubrobacteraceae bacterium]